MHLRKLTLAIAALLLVMVIPRTGYSHHEMYHCGYWQWQGINSYYVQCPRDDSSLLKDPDPSETNEVERANRRTTGYSCQSCLGRWSGLDGAGGSNKLTILGDGSTELVHRETQYYRGSWRASGQSEITIQLSNGHTYGLRLQDPVSAMFWDFDGRLTAAMRRN